MPRCACCTHPDLAEIDAAILAGETIRALGKRYGMSHTAVERHKKNHIGKALVKLRAAEREEAEELSALAEVRDLLPRMKRVLDDAEREGKTGNMMAVAAQIRPYIELLAKLTHEIETRPVTVINLQTSEEWLAVRGAIFQALLAYPEARQAVASNLLQLEAGK